MAPTLLVIALAFALSMPASHAGTNSTNVECKDLDVDSCAYAVSSSGKRCVLEKHTFCKGYTCRSSDISADKNLSSYVETKECVEACSVDRKALGISSDSLLERGFADRLCSDECYLSCPNIVDLYFNLAAGEGVYLPKFCEARKSSSLRREMIITSVGDGSKAQTPISSVNGAFSTSEASTSTPTPNPAPTPGSG